MKATPPRHPHTPVVTETRALQFRVINTGEYTMSGLDPQTA
jgi:hypothetical protein